MKRESTTVIAVGLVVLSKAQYAFSTICTSGSLRWAALPGIEAALLAVAAVLVWKRKLAGAAVAVPILAFSLILKFLFFGHFKLNLMLLVYILMDAFALVVSVTTWRNLKIAASQNSTLGEGKEKVMSYSYEENWKALVITTAIFTIGLLLSVFVIKPTEHLFFIIPPVAAAFALYYALNFLHVLTKFGRKSIGSASTVGVPILCVLLILLNLSLFPTGLGKVLCWGLGVGVCVWGLQGTDADRYVRIITYDRRTGRQISSSPWRYDGHVTDFTNQSDVPPQVSFLFVVPWGLICANVFHLFVNFGVWY